MIEVVLRPSDLHPTNALLAVDRGAPAAFAKVYARVRYQGIVREDLSADLRHPPLLIDDLSRVPLLPILLVEFDRHIDVGHGGHQTVLIDKAADFRLSQGLQMPEVHGNIVADLPDEPFVVLHREPVPYAPAVVAVAGRIERNHPISESQRPLCASRLFYPVVGGIRRASARVRTIGIGGMTGFEVKIDGRLRGIPANTGPVEFQIVLHLEAFDTPAVEIHVARYRSVSQPELDRSRTDAGPKNSHCRAGNAVLRDPCVGEKCDSLVGQDDDIRNGFTCEGFGAQVVTAIVDCVDAQIGVCELIVLKHVLSTLQYLNGHVRHRYLFSKFRHPIAAENDGRDTEGPQLEQHPPRSWPPTQFHEMHHNESHLECRNQHHGTRGDFYGRGMLGYRPTRYRRRD